MRPYRIIFPVVGALATYFTLAVTDPGMPDSSGFHKRMLALEFAPEQQDVGRLSAGICRKTQLNRALDQDTGRFIPFYWMFFIGMNVFLYANGLLRGRKWLLLLPLFISIAAVSDWVENASIDSAMNMTVGAADIHIASTTKWIAIGLSLVIVGFGFLRLKAWPLIAASLYLAAAVVMFAGLWMYHPWVEIAFGIACLGVTATGEAINVNPLERRKEKS